MDRGGGGGASLGVLEGVKEEKRLPELVWSEKVEQRWLACRKTHIRFACSYQPVKSSEQKSCGKERVLQ